MSTLHHPGFARARQALVVLLCGTSAWAAQVPVDETKIPPAAAVQVDFDRDIRPLLERSCLKCHGPERPKGRFRLDTRSAALKGGENGIDILPGQGSKSPLIHYVAGLVPDLEMPPKGKAEPLSRDEIALLRAWIDQGANWGTAGAEPTVQVVATPTVGWTTVRGMSVFFVSIIGVRKAGMVARRSLRSRKSSMTIPGCIWKDAPSATITG